MSEENETNSDDGFEDLNEDYYQILKVSPRATPEELKVAYRALAQRYHPDIDPKYEARFIKIANAYETLSDPELRNEYNKAQGHAYHAEVDINLRSEKYSFEKKNPSAGARQKVEIGASSISIDQFAAERASRTDEDLKINHKIALTESETLNAEGDDEGERVAAWGELENAGDSSRPGLKGVLGALRKRGNSDRRAQLKSKLKQTISDEMLPKQPAAPKARMHDSAAGAREKAVEPEAFRGERIYEFSVSELEAALGTTRTLVLEGRSEGEPERIEVDIPVGIENNTMMEVSRGWERAKVRIHIIRDPFFKIAENDVIMRIPVTLVEAIRGTRIHVPVVNGNGELILPKNASAWSGVAVAGGGLDIGEPGDAIIFPYVVPPKKVTATLTAAAGVIDGLCGGNVRAEWSGDPTAEQFWEIDDLSVNLFIPVLFGETLKGTSIDLNFISENLQATIQGPWDAKKPIVMAGKGPKNDDGRARDIYVNPVVELPNTTSESLEAALMAIEQHYLSDVRSELPRVLGRI